jgi:rhamnogalacturonan endolyase
MYGPWLLYINDGDLEDAAARSKLEFDAWPYTWLKETNYQNRGSLTGKLTLDDGRPAAGAAVFLGDEGKTDNQGSTYQYTSYADAEGNFKFTDVRREKEYTLQAWSNGGSIADVQNVFVMSNITVGESTGLGSLTWSTSGKKEE